MAAERLTLTHAAQKRDLRLLTVPMPVDMRDLMN